MKKTSKLLKAIVPVALVFMTVLGAQAAVYTFFSSEEVTVNVEGIEVYVDGELAQDLSTTDEISFLAGDSLATEHTIYYTGNGATLTVNFNTTGELEEGLSLAFLNETYQPINELTLTKGVNTTFYVDYTASAMMKTGTSYINWTVTADV